MGIQAVNIRYTGLRPGEKLHEALFSQGEHFVSTEHSRIYSTQRAQFQDGFDDLLTSLYDAAEHNVSDEVWRLLSCLMPNYSCPAGIPALTNVAPYPDDY
jgi:FlaA1/EpsC-like NDP-sugar epimerase